MRKRARGATLIDALGSCVLSFSLSLSLSPPGDSADRTLLGSQLQPLITPTARPSPLWSLTLGEEISRGGRGVHVCVCMMVGTGKKQSGDAGMRVRRKREEDVKRESGGKGRGWKENGGEQKREVSSQYKFFFNPKWSGWKEKMDTHHRQTLCQHHAW